MSSTNDNLPQLGQLSLAVGTPADNYVLAVLPIGDTSLHVEFIAVKVAENGAVWDVVDEAHRRRVEAELDINDNPDPEPLTWAGRQWLVLTDPYSR